MAIVTIKASKATPGKALDYITEKGKAALVSVYQLDPSQDLARQMMGTAKLWGKAQDEGDRKYYHLKISFDPKDWTRNGGPLTEQEALQIGMQIMREFCPGSESAGSVHTDKDHLHFHGVINAVDLETGKMLDMRNADYRRLKDRVQEICAERGLTAIDWRKATKEKRAREGQSWEAVDETFAEKGLKARGQATWKDELRAKIDAAVKSSCSMDEFRAKLQASGVTLTRCTEQTISYKLGDHKACRGDALGGDYTVAAIRDALDHNQEQADPERKPSLNDRLASIQASGYDRVIGLDERQQLRELGRLAGFKRSEIDQWCDEAPRATWEEKQKAWDSYKAAKAEFWDEYAIRQQKLRNEIDAAYKRRRKVKDAEWALNPRNRRSSLFGVIFAAIYLSRNDSSAMIDREIQELKRAQQQLRRDMATFKADTGEAVETLREKGLSLDAYMASVQRMQSIADQIQKKNAALLDVAEKERLRRQAEKAKQAARKSGPTR